MKSYLVSHIPPDSNLAPHCQDLHQALADLRAKDDHELLKASRGTLPFSSFQSVYTDKGQVLDELKHFDGENLISPPYAASFVCLSYSMAAYKLFLAWQYSWGTSALVLRTGAH